MTEETYTNIFYTVYISVLIMYTVFFVVRIFTYGLSRRLFLATTAICVTNSVLYLIHSVQKQSKVDTAIAISVLTFCVLLVYYYIAHLMNEDKKAAPKVDKEWLESHLLHDDFDEQLKIRLDDPRFGEGLIFEKGHSMTNDAKKKLIHKMRQRMLLEKRTEEDKISDIKTIERLRSKMSTDEQKEKQLRSILKRNPTFAYQVISELKKKSGNSKDVLKSVLSGPILDNEGFTAMRNMFGNADEPTDQQLRSQFFDKLTTKLKSTKQDLFSEKKRFDRDEFNKKFTKSIQGTDLSVWLNRQSKRQNKSKMQLLDTFTSDMWTSLAKERKDTVKRKGGNKNTGGRRR